MKLQVFLWLSVSISGYVCILQMISISENNGRRLSSPRQIPSLTSDDEWAVEPTWSYVRCELRPPIHITPQRNKQYESDEQRATCHTYPLQLSASTATMLQEAEWLASANRTMDSAYMTIRNTRHLYYAHQPTSSAINDSRNVIDVGGHITVIHENCHVNRSYADLNVDTADYINARYGPSSFELRIVGAEMQVLPLKFIPVHQYTSRHYQILEESRNIRPKELGATGQSRYYRQIQSQVSSELIGASSHVGVFCHINGTEDFGNGTVNAVTCRFHGNDRCIYEAAYAVSVSGEYSLQTYLIYVDYEGVSDVPPRNRWPRAQNALISRIDNRHIVATPQPWPRPKGYTDFLQYSPLPSPSLQQIDDASNKHPLTLSHQHYLYNVSNTLRIDLSIYEVAFNGRWVNKMVLPLLGISSGNVWWTIPHYPIPHVYFCTLANINDYVYVPYSFDHAFRYSLYQTQSIWKANSVTQRLNEIMTITDRQQQEQSGVNDQINSFFKKLSEWINLYLFNNNNYLNQNKKFNAPLFLLPLSQSFLPPNHRSKSSSFAEINHCFGAKRIALGGDSQTRTLTRHFATILAKHSVELIAQKWRDHAPLVWSCVIIQLNETSQRSQFTSNNDNNNKNNIISMTEHILLDINQTQICYFPMTDIKNDFLLQAIDLHFDVVIMNSGQHPLSYFDHMRSIPNYGVSLIKSINNIKMNYNKTLIQILQERFIWWTTMPLPRAFNQPMFERSVGDGRTQQRTELANEFSKGIMFDLFNITIFEVSESIHWPFVDCAHDFAHANEPTFYTIVAELMAHIQAKLKC